MNIDRVKIVFGLGFGNICYSIACILSVSFGMITFIFSNIYVRVFLCIFNNLKVDFKFNKVCVAIC